jgi:hypothetical protein
MAAQRAPSEKHFVARSVRRAHRSRQRLYRSPASAAGLARRTVTLVGGALAAVLLTTACGTQLIRGVEDGQQAASDPPNGVVQIAVLQSQSDAAETSGHLDAVMEVLVDPLADQGYEVLAMAAGARGLTGFEPFARANFQTDGVDGGNPVTHDAQVIERMAGFERALVDGVAGIPASNASDPFGAAAAAASLFAQYPADVPRVLVVVGDELATTPTGCVLTERDLSERYVDSLVDVCSPEIPSLDGVQVYLVGAGYSTDSVIPPATAIGLERVMRRFYELAGARVCVYGPMLVADGGQCS